MFAWLKRLLHRAPAAPLTWPRHLFVRIRGTGLGYAGLVNNEDEASDVAQLVVGSHVMKTGEMAFADHWTSERDAFTGAELEAFNKAPQEIRG